MKQYLPFLFLILCVTVASADVPKVFHVVKAKIQTNNTSYVTYALLIGELDYYDSLIKVYKKDSKIFTEKVTQLMQHRHDTLQLYSQIFHVREKGLILLPKDKETKILLKDVQNISLIEYFASDYSGGQVFNHVLSSDSTWLFWRISQTYDFTTSGGSGMCGFTLFHFNKPDAVSKTVVENFESLIRSREKNSLQLSGVELDRINDRLRKLRIVVVYDCGC